MNLYGGYNYTTCFSSIFEGFYNTIIYEAIEKCISFTIIDAHIWKLKLAMW